MNERRLAEYIVCRKLSIRSVTAYAVNISMINFGCLNLVSVSSSYTAGGLEAGFRDLESN